jgi:hypothetical protein
MRLSRSSVRISCTRTHLRLTEWPLFESGANAVCPSSTSVALSGKTRPQITVPALRMGFGTDSHGHWRRTCFDKPTP